MLFRYRYMFLLLSGILALILSCASAPEKEITTVEFFSLSRSESPLFTGMQRMNFTTEHPVFSTFEDLLQSSAIEIPAGERKQYIFGDNIAGYYEGYTHSFHRGEGYRMSSTVLFEDAAAAVDYVFLNRRINAQEAVLRPDGISHSYSQGTETFRMYPSAYTLSYSLEGSGPKIILPLLKTSPSRYRTEVRGSTLLLIPTRQANRDYPPVIAMRTSSAANVAGSLEAVFGAISGEMLIQPEGSQPGELFTLADSVDITALENDMVKALGIGERSSKFFFVSKEPVEQFSLFISFGDTEEEAMKRLDEVMPDPELYLYTILKSILGDSWVYTGDEQVDRALLWSRYSAYTMVVEEFGKGIWAGLPWFKDNWGRDTFIALPGTLLVNGQYDEAREVLRNFARLQNTDEADINFGRIPNRVSSLENIIYNTTDGTPWFIREVEEYIRYSGDLEFAKEMLPVIQRALQGAIRNYLDEEGFLTHDDADTWMDARIAGNLPWSARGNRAVEIQALMYTALRSGAAIAELAGEKKNGWLNRAETLKEQFFLKFWDGEVLADRLREDGSRDVKIRPNQLMTITVPFESDFLDHAAAQVVVKNTVSALLYEYGIASLSQDDPYFHPYHDETGKFHKDAAYHNGTVWGWNAGFTLSAMMRYGIEENSWKLIDNLADQIINLGTAGSMSELLDAFPDKNGDRKPSGTYSQAWSVSEFNRVLFQDAAGIRPNLIENQVLVSPTIPNSSQNFSAAAKLKEDSFFQYWTRLEGEQRVYSFLWSGEKDLSLIFAPLSAQGRVATEFTLEPGVKLEIVWDPSADLDGNLLFPADTLGLSGIPFVQPALDAEYASMLEQNYLQRIIEAGDFK
jgi:glycogen debranching enzyme